MLDLILILFYIFGAASFYFGLVSLIYYPLALAYPFWERRLLKFARAQAYAPFVTVLIPCYNEEKTIAASVASVLACNYPQFEIIVINDGSTDDTEAELKSFLQHEQIRYIRKANGGKASALNAGLAAANGEIVLFTDADSLFEQDTIRNGAAYFADARVGAVSGNDTPLHPRGPLQKMLVITSHIGTGFVRRALSLAGVLPIIAGNLGLVRTEILRRLGGFREIWGEDLELTVRLQRARVRVVYGASTRVLAECPRTLTGLWKQRVRWLRSYIKILWLHRDMVGNPRFGLFGPFLVFNAFNMVAIPFAQVLAFLLLPVAVLQDHFSLHGLEWVAYFGLGFLFAAAVVSILLDKTPRDLVYLPYAGLLLLFSQFYNAVVLYSLWAEARSSAEEWNKLDRRDPRYLPASPAHRSGRIAAGIFFLLVMLGAGYWLGARHAQIADSTQLTALPLVQQNETMAVAIHFDAWRDWRDAYRNLLATPDARYVNFVAVSAGRPDWTYFAWQGHEMWWSPEQKRAGVDMLDEALAALQVRGYRTAAILDVFAARYLALHPDEAALDLQGKRSKEVVCSTVLAEGAFGRHLLQATQALAAGTRADTVALTELFYDKHCYDDRCLLAFKKASGRKDWPRTAKGRIDRFDPVLGAWRSQQIAQVVAQLSGIVHRHNKKLAFDVKVSHDDILRNSAENGQDYYRLAPFVDEFVVWDYFAIAGLPPESSARVSAYFDDEFGADRFFLSIGLWNARSGFISPEVLMRSLRAAKQGGARQIWITPAKGMTPDHWKALADFVRGGLLP